MAHLNGFSFPFVQIVPFSKTIMNTLHLLMTTKSHICTKQILQIDY